MFKVINYPISIPKADVDVTGVEGWQVSSQTQNKVGTWQHDLTHFLLSSRPSHSFPRGRRKIKASKKFRAVLKHWLKVKASWPCQPPLELPVTIRFPTYKHLSATLFDIHPCLLCYKILPDHSDPAGPWDLQGLQWQPVLLVLAPDR